MSVFEEKNTSWGQVAGGIGAALFMALGLSFMGWWEMMESWLWVGLVIAIFLLIPLLIFDPKWLGRLLVGMLPICAHPDYSASGSVAQYLPFIIGLVLSVRILANKKVKRVQFPWKWLIPLFFYFTWSFISVFANVSSMKYFLKVVEELMWIGIVLPWFLLERKDKEFLLEWMLAFATGLVLVALYSLFFSPWLGKAAVHPFFSNGNFFSASLCLALPFTAWLAWSRSGAWRWIGAAASILFLGCILYFQSRGAWLGLAGGAFFALFFFTTKWSQRLFIALIAVSMGLLFLVWGKEKQTAVPESGWEQLKSISNTENNFSNRERIIRWKCALRMSWDRPLYGFGPNKFAPQFKHYLQDRVEAEGISHWYGWTGQAHNEYLSRLAERGWPGLLFFLAIWGFSLLQLYQLQRKRVLGRLWISTIAFALGTWMVHGIFNDLSQEPTVWLVLGGILFYVATMRNQRASTFSKQDFQAVN